MIAAGGADEREGCLHKFVHRTHIQILAKKSQTGIVEYHQMLTSFGWAAYTTLTNIVRYEPASVRWPNSFFHVDLIRHSTQPVGIPPDACRI